MKTVDLGIWGKLNWLIIGIGLLAGLVFVVDCYLPLLNQNVRMRAEILKYDDQIQREEARARKLKTSIEALRFDPKTVERQARQTLGYAKPGETVIRFEPAPTNSPAPR